MVIVNGGRGTGKTKRLLETAVVTGGTVVCRDPIKMIERAHKYGITGLNIISYDELRSGVAAEEPKYIHDVESFMTEAFPGIFGFSVCTD